MQLHNGYIKLKNSNTWSIKFFRFWNYYIFQLAALQSLKVYALVSNCQWLIDRISVSWRNEAKNELHVSGTIPAIFLHLNTAQSDQCCFELFLQTEQVPGELCRSEISDHGDLVCMSIPSTIIFPSAGSTSLNNAWTKVDLPLPVLPTTPIFSPPLMLILIPFRIKGVLGRYLTWNNKNGVFNFINDPYLQTECFCYEEISISDQFL